MSNLALEQFLNSHGIKLIRSDVGDKHVLDQMQKHELNFGGEQSGHIIYSDFARTGDALVSALLVLKLLLQSGKKASEILNPFKLIPQKQGAIKISQKQNLDEIVDLQSVLKDAEKDGIRHLIRYSGTEMKLRILLEGNKNLDEWYDKIELIIKKTHD
jgi:phosphoglucosamine mutase